MFSPTTTISFYETGGSDETHLTISITDVDQSDPVIIHLVAAFFLLAKDSMGGASIKDSDFQWQGDFVVHGFVVTNNAVDRFFSNVVRIGARFGVTTVARVVF